MFPVSISKLLARAGTQAAIAVADADEITAHYASLKTPAPPILLWGELVCNGHHRIAAALRRNETVIMAERWMLDAPISDGKTDEHRETEIAWLRCYP
jgi:hypothetical protein